MKRCLFYVAAACAVLSLSGCNGNSSSSSSSSTGTASNGKGEKPLVAFAQANSKDPWRQVFDKDIKDAADKHASEFDFDEQSADDDVSKQISQIETLMVKHPKVLLVSPVTEAAEQEIGTAHDAGALVILLDRSVPGNKWDVYIGGDNYDIGLQAGEYMAKRLNGKGTVLMIQGIADADPTKKRGGGFMDAMKKYPGITVIQGDDCGYQRAKAQTYMENFLQSKKPFDAVYAHNDEMAIGAYLAMKAANTPKKIIVGIDGCQKEVVQYIKDGSIDATFRYPQPGAAGIDIAEDFLKGKKPQSNKVLLPTEMVTKDTADKFLSEHPNLAG
jgi:ribose transport system substrate-binding protein